MRRLLGAVLAAVLTVGALGACSSDSDVASENLSKQAEAFKILRRVIFYNGITGEYILTIEGFCSVDPAPVGEMTVTCKIGDGRFKKHFLGKADNVTWFAEQLESANVSTDHYIVNFKPKEIVPDVKVR